MDTIAVVGASDRALALLARLAESRFEVVSISTSPERMRLDLRKRLPAASRVTWLAEVRFTSDLDELIDCSVVVDAYETADEAQRARVLRTVEAHMSTGAVLASPTADPESIAVALARPTQFVAILAIDSSPEPAPVDATAPGALFAVERLCGEFGPTIPRIRRDSTVPASLDLG